MNCFSTQAAYSGLTTNHHFASRLSWAITTGVPGNKALSWKRSMSRSSAESVAAQRRGKGAQIRALHDETVAGALAFRNRLERARFESAHRIPAVRACGLRRRTCPCPDSSRVFRSTSARRQPSAPAACFSRLCTEGSSSSSRAFCAAIARESSTIFDAFDSRAIQNCRRELFLLHAHDGMRRNGGRPRWRLARARREQARRDQRVNRFPPLRALHHHRPSCAVGIVSLLGEQKQE